MTCLITIVIGSITQILLRRSITATSLISLRLPRRRASLLLLLIGVTLTRYYRLGGEAATLR
jgi:hypothetical protein